jgi:2-keto-4-pentenoate hydratase/2-oxohepta-3-ene-1,7-dioic acid hydratase in catechol pathway
MKIAQFYNQGVIRLGMIRTTDMIPLDFQGDMTAFMKSGQGPVATGQPIPLEQVRLAPPVSQPSKIIAVGLNYKAHAKESKGKPPKEPLIFSKFPSSITGPNHDIVWDTQITNKVDFEAELIAVIGKEVYACSKTEAMDAIFGYTCGNDVSARDLQFGDRQWVRGKSLNTFAPVGPYIVTPDEIPDPQNLKISCLLNNQVMQESNTSQMIFSIPDLISFISKHMTLLPGDIVFTGTPEGVGAFRDPPIYMKKGDDGVVEIEGIGRLMNRCRPEG